MHSNLECGNSLPLSVGRTKGECGVFGEGDKNCSDGSLITVYGWCVSRTLRSEKRGNNMFRRLTAVCAACALFFWTAAAAAAPVYSFVFGQTSYSATPGGKVAVPVYWQETVGTGETAVLDPLSAVGMFNQGVQVRWNDPTVPSHPATVASTADIACNSAFSDTMFRDLSVSSDYAQLSEDTTDVSTFVYGTEISANVWRQLIGTFTFTAGSVAGEVTHLRATRYVNSQGPGDYIIDANGGSYDGVTAEATATITVLATPEPGSIVLLFIAGLGLLVRAWRRWR
jgi:hypothetical protein